MKTLTKQRLLKHVVRLALITAAATGLVQQKASARVEAICHACVTAGCIGVTGGVVSCLITNGKCKPHGGMCESY